MSLSPDFIHLPYGKVGVLSDVHDSLAFLRKALATFTERGIRTVLFAGDFCSPIPAGVMARFPGQIHAVWGNGDGDRWKIQQIADATPGILMIHGEFAHSCLDGPGTSTAKLALTHYSFYAQALARTGDYDAVFYGHTHVRKLDRYGPCLCVNPGGVLDWSEKAPSSFAIYDPDKNDVEFIELA
jgi:putative phosphoesterase